MLRGQGIEGKEPCAALSPGATRVAFGQRGRRLGVIAWPAQVAKGERQRAS
jgi:hypothetical protein